ncbi:hypothetical protein KCP73_08950 [Salmonella enterica subsp. enterica]|nr:hypothetical protein KCP73_08950 [Salmonella enterica subsp. enterica]
MANAVLSYFLMQCHTRAAEIIKGRRRCAVQLIITSQPRTVSTGGAVNIDGSACQSAVPAARQRLPVFAVLVNQCALDMRGNSRFQPLNRQVLRTILIRCQFRSAFSAAMCTDAIARRYSAMVISAGRRNGNLRLVRRTPSIQCAAGAQYPSNLPTQVFHQRGNTRRTTCIQRSDLKTGIQKEESWSMSQAFLARVAFRNRPL